MVQVDAGQMSGTLGNHSSVIRHNTQPVRARSNRPCDHHHSRASVSYQRSPNGCQVVLYATRSSLAGLSQQAGHSRTSNGPGDRMWPRVPCGAGPLRVVHQLPRHARGGRPQPQCEENPSQDNALSSQERLTGAWVMRQSVPGCARPLSGTLSEEQYTAQNAAAFPTSIPQSR